MLIRVFPDKLTGIFLEDLISLDRAYPDTGRG